MATAFEGSLTERMLQVLISEKNQGFDGGYRAEITSLQLQKALKDKFPKYKFKRSSFSTAYERIKRYGILIDSGAKIGKAKVFTIVPPADDIIDLYQHKGDANAMADARARAALERSEFAPQEKDAKVEIQKDDDEIDAWTFGEKIIRYISILKQKLNDRDAMLRERSEELRKAKSAINGLQSEIKKRELKINDLREGMKKRVSRGALEEANQKIKRLETLVDELRKKPGRGGPGFKLKDLARIR